MKRHYKTTDDLPVGFGKINGEDHPDTTVAHAATQAERERCAKIAEALDSQRGNEAAIAAAIRRGCQ